MTFSLQRESGSEEEKLKPSTETKTKYAKLIIEAYPELVSVDENCPQVRNFCSGFSLLFFVFGFPVFQSLFFKSYFKESLAGGVEMKHLPTGLIEENCKTRRADRKSKESARRRSQGFFFKFFLQLFSFFPDFSLSILMTA